MRDKLHDDEPTEQNLLILEFVKLVVHVQTNPPAVK